MKLIEAMKEVKNLERKCEDLIQKSKQYSADLDIENPTYPDQKAMVQSWIQGVHDTLKQIIKLRIAIQETNLKTIVPIEINGKEIKKPIAEWILRRRLYSSTELRSWNSLTDKGLRDGTVQNTAGERVPVKKRLYFDPIERDKKIEEFRSEPSIIDRTLEVVNATTDIVE